MQETCCKALKLKPYNEAHHWSVKASNKLILVNGHLLNQGVKKVLNPHFFIFHKTINQNCHCLDEHPIINGILILLNTIYVVLLN